MTEADLVDALLRARDHRHTTQPPTLRASGFDLRKAYRVGAALDRRLIERGYRRAGWKVGFTNRLIWPRFGLTQPIVGPVYDRTVRMADSLAELSLAPFHSPRIEVEVVFGIEQQEDGTRDWSRPNWMALGFEIVDCHYPGWHLTPADSVADFALHGALVVGPRVNRAAPGFEQRIGALGRLEVRLLRNGKPAARGCASDVLGSPLAALETVPGLMHWFEGLAPESPIVVSTGTMTELAPLAPGERWRVEVVGGVDLPGLELTLGA
ncbi:MAG: hydratase [Gemmatimonadota bacterium]|nr:hydratase [Gemmatimonadota bacterium]MDE2678823.1 hydratase [Gemmatimonadota bacterium]